MTNEDYFNFSNMPNSRQGRQITRWTTVSND